MFYGLSLDYRARGIRYYDMFTNVCGIRVHTNYRWRNGEWNLNYVQYHWEYSDVKIYFYRCQQNGGEVFKTYKDVTTHRKFKRIANY